MNRLVGALAGMAVLGAVSGAIAAPSPRVLIVEDERSGLTAALELELSSQGYATDEVHGDSSLLDADIAALVNGRSADAAIRVSAAGIDVWTKPPLGPLQRVEHLPAQGDPMLSAVRAAEALHAGLLHVAPPKAAPEISASPSAEKEAAPSQTAAQNAPEHDAPAFLASLGPSLWVAPGGLGATLGGWLAGSMRLTPKINADAYVGFPLASTSVDGAEGSARISLAMAGAGVSYAFAERGRVRPGLGLATGAGWVHMEGHAAAGFVSATSNVFTTTVILEPYCDLMASEQLGMRLTTAIGVALPPPTIVFAGREVATWGEPIFGLALAPLIRFPTASEK